MGPDRETLDLLAAALEYPRSATAGAARRAAERTAGDHIALARALWDLAVALETARGGEAEERYTALFDLDPVCTLNVGYHLFGESYPRGAFLAGLLGELRRSGLADGGELPDFLPTLLRLLGRLEDAEDQTLLLERALLPGLARMAAALGESRSPWSDVVRALPGFLAPLGAGEPAVAADATPGPLAAEAGHA